MALRTLLRNLAEHLAERNSSRFDVYAIIAVGMLLGRGEWLLALATAVVASFVSVIVDAASDDRGSAE